MYIQYRKLVRQKLKVQLQQGGAQIRVLAKPFSESSSWLVAHWIHVRWHQELFGSLKAHVYSTDRPACLDISYVMVNVASQAYAS